jgi:hypothetical protein
VPIEGEDQLRSATSSAGQLLQEIQNFLGQNTTDAARVRFPRGFIRTAAHHRANLPFIERSVLLKNLSYAHMALDVYRWILTRTDLGGQAIEMIIKEAVCLTGSICEALTIRPGYRGLGKNNSFSNRVARLRQMAVVSRELQAELLWVWEIRCREHIGGVDLLEWGHYRRSDYERANTALERLIVALTERFAD